MNRAPKHVAPSEGISLFRSSLTASVCALAALVAGCSASPSAPGTGDLVATLPDGAIAASLANDGTAIHLTTILPSATTPAVTFSRVSATGLVAEPVAPFNAAGFIETYAPGTPALVAVGGGAAFLGSYGDFVDVPLDGGPTTTVAQPGLDAGIVGAMAADGAGVYTCFSAPEVSYPTLWRLAPGEAPALLSTGTFVGDDCSDLAVTVGAGGVFWATAQTIMRWDIGSGATTQVAPVRQFVDSLVVSNGFLFVGEWNAIERIDLTDGSETTLLTVPNADAILVSLAVDGDHLYALSQTDLRRMALDGSSLVTLAHRGVPGAFTTMAVGDGLVYFTNLDPEYDDEGESFQTTVRSVAE